MNFSTKRFTLIFLCITLTACTHLTPDGDEAEVRRHADELLGQPTVHPNPLQTERDALLSQTLTVDSAVRLALINNPRLQSNFAQLQLTEAEVISASRLRNPGFSIADLSRGSEHEVERAVSFDLMGLLTLPLRSKMAKQQFETLKQATTAELLTLAYATRQAYYTAIAATQRTAYAADVQTAAEAANQLATDLAKAGNISRLDAAREQVFYAQAHAQYTRLVTQQQATREQLIRLLGLNDNSLLKLPDHLDELPPEARTLNQVEQFAMQQRIDVQLAKQQAAQTAQSLTLSKVTRFINVLELGYQSNTSNQQPTQKGFEVRLELPLFDFGRSRIEQAEAIYRRALADVATTAINARSQARETYARYHSEYALAKHYRDHALPLQQQISQEMLLRYNGMLISPFELLAQAREQIDSSERYLTALENFWLASADLDNVLQGNISLPTTTAMHTNSMQTESTQP